MLTGKDVREATLFATSENAGGQWNKLSTYDKHIYEVAASVLNGTHIAPLQGLVKDYKAMLNRWDPITPDFPLTNHFYDKQRLELDERTHQLLGEEPKS